MIAVEVACKNWDLGKRDPPPRDFLAELHVYRLLHHENLLMFIGGASEPGNAFLLTEFASGGSLDGFLGKQVRDLNIGPLCAMKWTVFDQY
jgi:serine/threonine protein kinase